jgi:hypothetical protein
LSIWLYHLQMGIMTYSFSTYIPFISFSFLIDLAKISRNILNNGGESGQLCLSSYLKGHAFVFPQIQNTINKSFIIFVFYYMNNHSPIPNFFRVLSWKDAKFSQSLFLHLLKWSYNFCTCFNFCAVLHLLICICWAFLASLG